MDDFEKSCLFQSALTGGIVGVLSMSWVSLNAQWAIASGALRFEHKPMAVDQCPYNFEPMSSMANATGTQQQAE